jgi:putative hemolysin
LDLTDLKDYVILLFLFLLSALLSTSETAISSLNEIKLRNIIDNKLKNFQYIEKIMQDPNILLNAILIGNNIANTLISVLTTSIFIRIYGNNPAAISIATVIVAASLIFFAEIMPKNIAQQSSERLFLMLAKPLLVFLYIVRPVVLVVNIIVKYMLRAFSRRLKKGPVFTESELKTMIKVGQEEGIIEIDERHMINNVFAFGDFAAKDVMTPRTDIVAVSSEMLVKDSLELFRSEQFSRMPIYKDSIDNIIGIIYIKDIFLKDIDSSIPVTSCMRDAYYTYDTKHTIELFKIMRTKRIPMAVVLDEYGGTSGIITIEDLVEEIVGNIDDEYDDPEEDIKIILPGNEYYVSGDAKIMDVNKAIDINLNSDVYDSISGYVIGLIGRIPELGEIIEQEGITFFIEELDKTRISKLRIYISVVDNVSE